MTHYDTLGVAPDADQATIRAAYRRLARRYHPDSGRTDAAAMAALNEAYRVLREPARRAAYDASIRPTSAHVRAPETSAAAAGRPPEAGTGAGRAGPSHLPLVPAGKPRFPWKLVLFMFSVGALAVLVLAALAEPASPPPADNLLEPGSCVELEPNGDAREVLCDGDGDRVVAALVPTGDPCPEGTEAHRDRQGRGTACLQPAPAPPG